MEEYGDLRRRSELCIGLFKTAAIIPELVDDDWLEDRSADFTWWNHGLSVLKTGHASLDYRVRDRPDVQRVIVNVLQGLFKALKRCLEIFDEEQQCENDGVEAVVPSRSYIGVNIHGSTVDKLGLPVTSASVARSSSPPGNGAVSPWSELSDAESEMNSEISPTETIHGPYTEQRFYIEMYLGLLTTISISIRKAGAKIRYIKADTYLEEHCSLPEYNTLRDHLTFILTVASSHPGTTKGKQLLANGSSLIIDASCLTAMQRRLIEANVVRRNRIVYDRNRSRIPIHQIAKDAPLISFTRIIELEKQTTGVYGPFQYNHSSQAAQFNDQARSVATHSNRSATEMGSDFVIALPQVRKAKSTFTRITRTGAKLDYPRPPPGKGSFQCSYCVQVLPESYRSDSKWRGHVAQDLNPYSCIYIDCSSPDELYASKEEWVKHIRTQHSVTQWVCDECTFDTSDDEQLYWDDEAGWREHTMTHHKHVLRGSQLSLLSKMSQRSLVKETECPLCSSEQESSKPVRPDLDEHIAEHLHAWALRALPWNDDINAAHTNASIGSDNRADHLSYIDELSDITSEDGNDEGGDTKTLLQKELSICAQLSGTPGLPRLDIIQRVMQTCSAWLDQSNGAKQLEAVLQNIMRVRQSLVQISDSFRPSQELPAFQQDGITERLVDDLTVLEESLKGFRPISAKGEGPPFVLPADFRPNIYFVGRENAIRDLDSLLFGMEHNSVVWIQGPPGIGKTHLIRQYVYRHKKSYPGGIFWIRAKSDAELEHGYVEIARSIAADEDDIDGSDTTKFAITWLNQHRDWLLVIDGVGDRMSNRRIEEYVPSIGHGKIIITSTEDPKGFGATTGPTRLSLDPLTSKDAQWLLLEEMGNKAPWTKDDLSQALEIVQLCRCLPLAIHAAATHLKATREPLSKFVRLNRRAPKSELGVLSVVKQQLWERGHTAALNLLSIITFFGEHIPLELLNKGLQGLDRRTPMKMRIPGDRGEPTLAGSLRALSASGLIERADKDEDDDTDDDDRSGMLPTGDDVYPTHDPRPIVKIPIVGIHGLAQTFFVDALVREKLVGFWLERAICVYCHAFDEIVKLIVSDPYLGVKDDYLRLTVHGRRLEMHLSRFETRFPELASSRTFLNSRVDSIQRKIRQLEKKQRPDAEMMVSVFEVMSSSQSVDSSAVSSKGSEYDWKLREDDWKLPEYNQESALDPETYGYNPYHWHVSFPHPLLAADDLLETISTPNDSISRTENFDSMTTPNFTAHATRMEVKRSTWRSTPLALNDPRVSISREVATGSIDALPPKRPNKRHDSFWWATSEAEELLTKIGRASNIQRTDIQTVTEQRESGTLDIYPSGQSKSIPRISKTRLTLASTQSRPQVSQTEASGIVEGTSVSETITSGVTTQGVMDSLRSLIRRDK